MDNLTSSSSNLAEKPSQSAPNILQIPSNNPTLERDSTIPDVPTPLARARVCDVYIAHNRNNGPPLSNRLVNWLESELELLGVSVIVSTDRSKNNDAVAHCAARIAMEAAQLGVVVATVASLSNVFSIEETLVFSRRNKLVTVFVGLTRDDCVSLDIIERKGGLWGRFGGELWKGYGGRKEDWMAAVESLSRADMNVEVNAMNLRDCMMNLVGFIAKRLGKKSIYESVKMSSSESCFNELPYPRNSEFSGRKQELRQLEFVLFGYIEDHNEKSFTEAEIENLTEREKGKGKALLSNKEEEQEQEQMTTITVNRSYNEKGVICVTGESGIGKTELLLEFAYRHSQKYKAVFWVRGEARFLRESYMKLSGPLGVDAGIDNGSTGVSSAVEDEAIGKVRRELARGIPYLVLIDNLEAEKDFWDGRPVSDLLPGFNSQTHVLISTRLPGISSIAQFELPFLTTAESMALMKGNNCLSIRNEDDNEDENALNVIQERLRRLPFGLVLVHTIVSGFGVSAQTLLEMLENSMIGDILCTPTEDHVFERNPFLVQLLNVFFSLFNRHLRDGTSHNSALNMIEMSSWFGPSLVPVRLLAYVASEGALDPIPDNIWKKFRNGMLSLPCIGALNAEGNAAAEVLSTLIKLGVAKTAVQPGHVSFHDIFKSYARKRSDVVEPNNFLIEAIINEGFLPEHSHHAWAASFLVLKFGSYHPVPINLIPCDIILFVKRILVPLVTYDLNEFSLCSAVLELLRVTARRLESLENSLLHEVENSKKIKSLFCSNKRPLIESEPSIHRDIVTMRASVLETRAKILIRMGNYGVAEDLCRIAVNIREVIYGLEHVETQSARKIMDLIASFNKS